MLSILSKSSMSGPQTRAWVVLRFLAGAVLLVAAGLKAQQLLTGPAPGGFWWDARPWQAVAVGVEIALAGWLWSGFFPRPTRWLGAILFAGFSVLTLTKAFAGADSCGCFGAVTVSPWITLGLDLTICAAFLAIQPLRTAPTAASEDSASAPVAGMYRGGPYMRIAFAILGSVIGIGLGLWVFNAEPAQLQAQSGELIGDANFVILDTEPWIGHGFPLFDYTDLPDDVRQGRWWVMLYSHTCGHCLETIPMVEAKAATGQAVALVSMPPHAETPPTYGVNVQARLDTTRDWFAQAPVLIELHDGLVVRAAEGNDADSWF